MFKCLPDVIDSYCKQCIFLTDKEEDGVIHMIGSFDNACAYTPKCCNQDCNQGRTCLLRKKKNDCTE